MTTQSGGTALPLVGVKVVEIGTSVAAPYGTWILAALGAEVVKVERPGVGDDARHWGPPFWHGAAAFFQALNRDKRSIAVDLKDPEERAWLRGYLGREAEVGPNRIGTIAVAAFADASDMAVRWTSSPGRRVPKHKLPAPPALSGAGRDRAHQGTQGRPRKCPTAWPEAIPERSHPEEGTR